MSCSPAPLVADPWTSAAARAAGAARPVPRSGDGDGLLTAIATGLASVALPWELATGEHPADRQFQLLIATDVYDAWLVHWPVGTGLDLHDHGGSAGAFAVVAGNLDEDVVRDGTTVTTRVGPGASVVFGEGHVHAVVNRGGVGATSVHVYSPPLASMGYYRHDAGGELVAERVEAVAGASP
ncbi:MAG TPA: cysteine dioxygenase family protein [Ilumatobacteraceae bacterium]